jgi:hypothetical protein
MGRPRWRALVTTTVAVEAVGTYICIFRFALLTLSSNHSLIVDNSTVACNWHTP